MNTVPREAQRLRLYVNANQRWRGEPVYEAVVKLARSMNLAGASVFGVHLSFGDHHQLHDADSEYLFVDLPVVVEIIDAPERIAALRQRLAGMVHDGLATLDPVRIVYDGPAASAPAGPSG